MRGGRPAPRDCALCLPRRLAPLRSGCGQRMQRGRAVAGGHDRRSCEPCAGYARCVACGVANGQATREFGAASGHVPKVRVPRIGVRVPRIGIRVPRIGIRVPRIGVTVPRIGIRVPRIGVRVPRIGVRVPRIGIRVPQQHVRKVGRSAPPFPSKAFNFIHARLAWAIPT